MLFRSVVRAYGVARGEPIKLVYLADTLQSMLLVYLVTGTFVDFAYFDVLYYVIATIVILRTLVLQPSNEPTLAATRAAYPAHV